MRGIQVDSLGTFLTASLRIQSAAPSDVQCRHRCWGAVKPQYTDVVKYGPGHVMHQSSHMQLQSRAKVTCDGSANLMKP